MACQDLQIVECNRAAPVAPFDVTVRAMMPDAFFPAHIHPVASFRHHTYHVCSINKYVDRVVDEVAAGAMYVMNL